jgi:hypothetical protein
MQLTSAFRCKISKTRGGIGLLILAETGGFLVSAAAIAGLHALSFLMDNALARESMTGMTLT